MSAPQGEPCPWAGKMETLSGEREIVAAQRIEELLRQFLGLARAEQIRPARGINEQRVAREHAPRRIWMILLRHLVAHVLGRVPRRMAHRDRSFHRNVNFCPSFSSS